MLNTRGNGTLHCVSAALHSHAIFQAGNLWKHLPTHHTLAKSAFGRYFPTHTAEPAATRVQLHQILIPVSENQGKHACLVNLAVIYT